MAHIMHMDSGAIRRTLFSFALPVLLTQLLQELYNVADCAVLGHFGGANALASSGIAGLVLSVLVNFFIGFSSGVSAVTAQQFGRGELSLLQKTMTSVFRLVLLAGLLLSFAGVAAAGWLLELLRCPTEVLASATAYLRICSCGVLAQMFYNVAVSVLRSLGDSRGPLLCFCGSAIANLALDALFVIGFHRGVCGAAGTAAVSAPAASRRWLFSLPHGGSAAAAEAAGDPEDRTPCGNAGAFYECFFPDYPDLHQ